MRFVTLETRRIDLKDGPGGEKRWIEVKKELNKGEDSQYRTRGFRKMSQGKGEAAAEIDVDWQALALARVETYLVDWSAVDAKGKQMPVTPSHIRNLDTESFDEIDAAIDQHIREMAESKKTTTSPPLSSTATSS